MLPRCCDPESDVRGTMSCHDMSCYIHHYKNVMIKVLRKVLIYLGHSIEAVQLTLYIHWALNKILNDSNSKPLDAIEINPPKVFYHIIIISSYHYHIIIISLSNLFLLFVHITYSE